MDDRLPASEPPLVDNDSFPAVPRPMLDSLPLYLNNQLAPAERAAVAAWLADDPAAQAELAFYRQLQAGMGQRPLRTPPPALARTIAAQETAAPRWRAARTPAFYAWFYRGVGAAMSLLVLLLLWGLVQPGLALEWTVSGQQPEAFRVYRAPLDGGAPTLLSEIPVQPETAVYRYVDSWLLAGAEYRYWVEAINGDQIQSEWAVGRSWELLPYQLALLLVSLLIGYSLVLLLQAGTDYWVGRGRGSTVAI
jgi:anti-sigma factor RsiW